MSKTLGQRKRVPLLGFSDGLVIVVVLLVMLAIPAGIRHRSEDRYSTEQSSIDLELRELPLIEVDWETDVETDFGTVDLPGEDRTVRVQPSQRQADLSTPIAEARLVGGRGQGVGVVAVDYPDDMADNEKLRGAGAVVDRIAGELGVDADPFGLVRLSTDPAVRIATSSVPGALVGDYFLAPEATFGDTTIRIRTVEEDDTTLYVISVWPADEDETVGDRMEQSAVIE